MCILYFHHPFKTDYAIYIRFYIMWKNKNKQITNKELPLLEQFEACQTRGQGEIGEFEQRVTVSLLYVRNFVTMHLQCFVCIFAYATLRDLLLSFVFSYLDDLLLKSV